MKNKTFNGSELFPNNSFVNDKNNISINGVDLKDLAEEYGTPLYVYDEETIIGTIKDFQDSFTNEIEDSIISYSTKAFSNPYILNLLNNQNMSIDVVTGGELAVAKHVKFDPKRINFHGNNKSILELSEAVDYGINHITIDSFNEIDNLKNIAEDKSIIQDIMLRVSPSIDPHTHLLTTTGILDSKFGFSIETGDAEKAIEQIMKIKSLNLLGLHFHLGSPIFELEPYSEAIDYVYKFASDMKKKYEFEMLEFSPGGGFAIGYLPQKKPLSIHEYAKTICNSIKESCDKYGFDIPKITLEPGRALIGRAGVSIYRVGSIKKIPSVRNYISVDGGMGDNIRPALYGSEYSVFSITKVNQKDNLLKSTVSGKFCESGDILAKDVMLPNPQINDLLALPASGAYNLAMASNYNMQTRPAVVVIKDKKPLLIRRRETYEDLLSTSLL
ncbi:MAG: diaminopimelate decarboxylase [Dehalococcoidia bacterium]|nr:diaminopimelate decarboxylase [Dehalococcoidia bacterium]|tara:strand:- start:310 stop:1638 length:1329 start_codon:yes stop_codon:yes gene_type:complete